MPRMADFRCSNGKHEASLDTERCIWSNSFQRKRTAKKLPRDST